MVTVVVGTIAFALIVLFVVITTSERPVSDSTLITKFKKHESGFLNLAGMAEQDPTVNMILDSVVSIRQQGENSIYLHRSEAWPKTEAQLGFSDSRWQQYLDEFQKLGLEGGLNRKSALPGAVFFCASITEYDLGNLETAMIEKGYAYSSINAPVKVWDSLDDVDVNRPAIFFRKLRDHWYLYYEWSISKPE
jgi:hypothetical protein